MPPPPQTRGDADAAAGGDDGSSGGLNGYYDTFSSSASTAEPRPPLPEWMQWRSGIAMLDTFLDDVQDPTQSSAPEPDFKASELPKTIDRFWAALRPFIAMIDSVEDIMHYTQPRVTLCFLGYYVMLVWYGICIPGALMLVIALLVKDWAEVNGHLDPSLLRMGRAEDDAVPASLEPEAETPVAVVQPQPPQQRARGGLLGGLVDFAIGKVEMATQKYQQANKAAGKVTTTLNHYSTVLEKAISLVDWSIPNNTWMVVGVLGVLCLITLIVPWDYIAFVLKVQFGLKVFITEYLFHSKEHLKLKYSSVYRFWMNLPTKGLVNNGGSTNVAADTSSSTSSVVRRSPEPVVTEQTRAVPGQEPAPVIPAQSPTPEAVVTEKPAPSAAAPDAAPAAAPMAAAPTGGGSAPYTVTAPKKVAAKQSIVTALGERVLGSWQGIYMNAKRPAKLVLTTDHFCIQRGNGDVDSGSELFELSRVVSMSKQGSKMMSGWSLSIVIRPRNDAASDESETHKFQMQKRDEVYNAICGAANIPPDDTPVTDPTAKKSE